MKKTIRTVLYLSAALMALSCNTGNNSNTASPAAVPVEDEAVLVSVIEAITQDIDQTEVYSSVVQANAVNNIAPQNPLRIQKINVEIGDYVSKGQVVAEMDRVQLDQTRLKLVNDSTELSRVKQLYEEGAVSKSDFEALELAYNVSRSSYQNLLENTVLRSPIKGVITARNYDRGDLYSMGQPIYVVQEITPVKILVGISESDYTKVKRGDSVNIKVDALPGRTFSGRVNRIYPIMDAVSHTFTVEVQVVNSDRALRPGMYAEVEVSFGVNHSVVVPDVAIVKQQGSGQRFVYVLQADNTVKLSPVVLGRHFDTNYEILSGVAEGDVVVTKGHATLKNGSKVKVAE